MNISLVRMMSTAICMGAMFSAVQPERTTVVTPTAAEMGVAVLAATQGNDVTGEVTFKEMEGAVQITGRIAGLSPGKHGFHIHQFGDLRAPDGTAAGGHFNPRGVEHGGPHDDQHHAGDLGNITANERGVAMIDMKSKNFRVEQVIGRAVVVHAGADDLKSQPSGDAGPRVAVGVIGLANAEAEAK